MNQQLAKDIFEIVSKSELERLKQSLFKNAIRYAHIRAEWSLSDAETRMEMDARRTLAHNALIDSVNILARNMKQNGEPSDWYKYVQDNRIAIAELACWIHNFLSLSA